MTCHDIERFLPGAAEGTLTQRETALVEIHCASCGPCREHRDELSAILRLSRAADLPVPRTPPPPVFTPAPAPRFHRQFLPALVTIVLLAVFIPFGKNLLKRTPVNSTSFVTVPARFDPYSFPRDEELSRITHLLNEEEVSLVMNHILDE